MAVAARTRQLTVAAENRLLNAVSSRAKKHLLPLIKLALDTGGRHGEPRMDLLKSAPLDDLIAHPVRSKIDENDPEEMLLPSSPTTPDSIPLSSIVLSIT